MDEREKWQQNFATRLTALRSAAQMTQARLAALAGLHHQSVWSYEVGRRVPGLYEAVCLARALECKLDDLAVMDSA